MNHHTCAADAMPLWQMKLHYVSMVENFWVQIMYILFKQSLQYQINENMLNNFV